jgi:hypothetical protein
MAKKNTIGLLERATDTFLYPQIPPIKPEIPWGNADVLRELYGLQSTRRSCHTLTSSDTIHHHPATWLVSMPFSCLFVASLTHLNQVNVIKGKFLTRKECQKAYAAYAVNIDARWFDVTFTGPGEMHEIIGANKSYRSGINGVIPSCHHEEDLRKVQSRGVSRRRR